MYIDDGVSSIIKEKLNGEGLVYTLSTETLTEESTQEISQDLKVVKEAGLASQQNSITEEPVDNKSKSTESGSS
ncbi:17692_t:CDS:2 [Dentiscutata erythropus]|uniref:17692_t:CDS:1 n=1 Tax=Dentiscutata erythropus TaxID=1348616 RepID=A0A9N9J7M2_9GLOM|nr:17692_t:CDS:2 [Dentiscutata erythropus]